MIDLTGRYSVLDIDLLRQSPLTDKTVAVLWIGFFVVWTSQQVFSASLALIFAGLVFNFALILVLSRLLFWTTCCRQKLIESAISASLRWIFRSLAHWCSQLQISLGWCTFLRQKWRCFLPCTLGDQRCLASTPWRCPNLRGSWLTLRL